MYNDAGHETEKLLKVAAFFSSEVILWRHNLMASISSDDDIVSDTTLHSNTTSQCSTHSNSTSPYIVCPSSHLLIHGFHRLCGVQNASLPDDLVHLIRSHCAPSFEWDTTLQQEWHHIPKSCRPDPVDLTSGSYNIHFSDDNQALDTINCADTNYLCLSSNVISKDIHSLVIWQIQIEIVPKLNANDKVCLCMGYVQYPFDGNTDIYDDWESWVGTRYRGVPRWVSVNSMGKHYMLCIRNNIRKLCGGKAKDRYTELNENYIVPPHNGDTMEIHFDFENMETTFYHNGLYQGKMFKNIPCDLLPAVVVGANHKVTTTKWEVVYRENVEDCSSIEDGTESADISPYDDDDESDEEYYPSTESTDIPSESSYESESLNLPLESVKLECTVNYRDPNLLIGALFRVTRINVAYIPNDIVWLIRHLLELHFKWDDTLDDLSMQISIHRRRQLTAEGNGNWSVFFSDDDRTVDTMGAAKADYFCPSKNVIGGDVYSVVVWQIQIEIAPEIEDTGNVRLCMGYIEYPFDLNDPAFEDWDYWMGRSILKSNEEQQWIWTKIRKQFAVGIRGRERKVNGGSSKWRSPDLNDNDVDPFESGDTFAIRFDFIERETTFYHNGERIGRIFEHIPSKVFPAVVIGADHKVTTTKWQVEYRRNHNVHVPIESID